jgi:Ser-tRNA(Ala) deacylase AlaX
LSKDKPIKIPVIELDEEKCKMFLEQSHNSCITIDDVSLIPRGGLNIKKTIKNINNFKKNKTKQKSKKRRRTQKKNKTIFIKRR